MLNRLRSLNIERWLLIIEYFKTSLRQPFHLKKSFNKLYRLV